MTRRPFDPNELDQPSVDADRAVAALESYLADTATGAPRSLEARVMAAIEQEPPPRRGFLAWLGTPSTSGGGTGRFARAGLMAATLVVAVAVALFAGQLADLVRNVGNGSPTPSQSVSPNPSESVMPSPTMSHEATSAGSPEASGDAQQSPGTTGTPDETPEESPEDSDDSGEASRTPRPSATASPSATATATPGP